ncbi:hypothetical protein ACLB2K_018678 [Fragaria x ananassa]
MATRTAALTIRELENSFVPKLLNCKTKPGLKKIHAQIVKLSLSQSNFLMTKMVDVCDYSGNVDYASLLFKEALEPNVFLFNAMIRAYTHNHVYDSAIALYKQMLRHPESETLIFPDKFTFPFVIKCCAGLGCEDLGRQIHGQVWKFGPGSHLLIENALMDFYTKCDNLRDAHKVFEEMTERDVISWNSLLSGYVRLGQMRKARMVFEEMTDKTIVSWTAMVSGYSDKKRLLQAVSVCNALIEMYVKCGCIDQAWQLFDQMSGRDVISWSTMIAGLANNGKACEAFKLFQDMQRAKIAPDVITFLGLLSACSHAGLWKEGLHYFDFMREEYKIEPGIEHYGCLVDLLGRAGHLDQALDKIQQMPMKPDIFGAPC